MNPQQLRENALRPARHWGRAVTGAALIASAGLLVAACSSGGVSSSSSIPGNAPAPAHALPGAEAGGSAGVPRALGPPPGSVRLAGLPVTGQSLIQTASLTVRSRDLQRSAGLATQIITAAGGYVSGENTRVDPAHPGRSTVSLQLKIPAAAYPATLAALASGRIGKQVSLSRRATDVTQTVADVNSRVASAKAAIVQLRALLAHAGSVSSLLQVQNQINEEEANLESLQSQQRALAGQTSYATVSLLIVGKAAPVHHRHHPAGGFLGGLRAGWHALVRVTVLVLTGFGAALPFLIIAGLAALAAWRARRWRLGRRPRPDTTA